MKFFKLFKNYFLINFIFLLTLYFVTTEKLFSQTSQTEAYLNALAPTQKQAFEKISKVLTAPKAEIFTLSEQEQIEARKDTANFIKINPNEYIQQIKEVIETEKKHPDYYVLYHGTQQESLFIYLFSTYLAQAKYGWTRDDFFIFRFPNEFYKPKAKTALDYIKQNTYPNKQQDVATNINYDILRQFAYWPPYGPKDYCQLDMLNPFRTQLLSTSISFISGVDETNMDIRLATDQDFPAWESAFYYFATNLSWSDIDSLYNIIIRKIKKECEQQDPAKIYNSINSLTRKYIALRFNGISTLLQPLAKGNEIKVGIMLQLFIPKNILDDIAYLSWQNGAVWQKKISGINDGWNNSLGLYSKLSKILDFLQKEPHKFGNALHLLQARLIFKDEKYLFSPESPIKMNLITTLPKSLMRSIQDTLKSLAKVIFEFNQNATKGVTQLQEWAEKINLEHEVDRLYNKMRNQLDSKNTKMQLLGLRALKYLITFGEEIELTKTEVHKLSESSDQSVQELCKEITEIISYQN